MATHRQPGWLRMGLWLSLIVAGCAIGVAQVRDPVVQTLIGVAAALVAGFVVYAPMSRISRLAEQARRLTVGQPAGTITDAPEREIAELSHSLSTLSERLEGDRSSLRDRHAELDALMQAVESGVVILDREQRVVSVNAFAERIMGDPGRSSRGQLIHEVARTPSLLRFVSEVMERPRLASAEMEIQGDIKRTIRVTSGSLRDPAGQVTGAVVLLTDITQLKRLESMRSDFAANVSHELRTPITNIKGYAETLLEVGLSDPELATKFLKIVAANADRLGAIVDDILALTTLERAEDDETLVTTISSIKTILDAARVQQEPAAVAKQISIHSLAPPELEAMVNPRLIEQGVSNLIDNAVKYSPSGTRITVRASPVHGGAQGPLIEISVTDEGPGIPPEHLSRIFERFYRVDKARSREQGGTGLGLAIVKHIALVHGGHVAVESAPGKGSTFRMTIPVG